MDHNVSCGWVGRRARVLAAWGIVLLAAALLANRAAVTIAHRSSGREAADNDAELIVAEDLVVGRVYDGGSVHEHVVRIRNPNDAPLTLGRFSASCDCLRITPGAGTVIGPHESRPFQLQLSPKRAVEARDPWTERPFQIDFGTTGAVDGFPPRRVSWTLVGTIVPTLQFDPPIVHIGTNSQRAATIARSLTIESGPAVDRVEVDPPRDWTATLERRTGGGGRKHSSYRLQYVGDLRPRSVGGAIRVRPVAPNGTALPEHQIPIAGEIVRDIVAVPAALLLGRRNADERATEWVTFRSLTGRSFEITRAGASDATIWLVRRRELPPAYEVLIKVRTQQSTPVRLEFWVRESDGTEYPVILPLSYEAVLPR